MASKAKRPGSVIVRGGRRSDASTRGRSVCRARPRARGRSSARRRWRRRARRRSPWWAGSSAQAAAASPWCAPRSRRFARRWWRHRSPSRCTATAIRRRAGRRAARGESRRRARGCARRRRAAAPRSPGAVVGAAACSPHPARAKAEAAAARIAREARTMGERMALRLHPSRPGGSRPQSAGPIDSVRSPRSWVVRGAFGAALRFLPHRGKEGGVCRGPGGPLGARGARRGVPSHFARVSQHLPPGARSNVGLAPSGRGRTDVRRRRLRPRALRARTSAR